jgi:hypothetical protein
VFIESAVLAIRLKMKAIKTGAPADGLYNLLSESVRHKHKSEKGRTSHRSSAFIFKWRRRELNPDPKADHAGIYMLSRFSFLASLPRK